MRYKLKVYSIMEFGQRKDSSGKPHQEDCIYPAYGKQKDTDRLFILCDGMGGHDAGEVASATVCDAMSRTILTNSHEKDGIFTSDDFLIALEAAFNALDEQDTHAEKKMGTTLAFLKFHERGAFIAHVGDSRIYHIRPGRTGQDTDIRHETSDHSLVNDLIKVGELTKEEARSTGQKNVITRAMQPHLECRPKATIYETTDIKPGDYFYLCSDGMLEQMEMENGTSLKHIFSHEGGKAVDKVKSLRKLTEQNQDNHSAFIILVQEVLNEDASEQSLPRSKVDHIVDVSDSNQYKSLIIKIICVCVIIAALTALISMFI